MKILSTPENHHTFPLAIITSKSTFANCWAWNVVTPVPSPGNETRSISNLPVRLAVSTLPIPKHFIATTHVISFHHVKKDGPGSLGIWLWGGKSFLHLFLCLASESSIQKDTHLSGGSQEKNGKFTGKELEINENMIATKSWHEQTTRHTLSKSNGCTFSATHIFEMFQPLSGLSCHSFRQEWLSFNSGRIGTYSGKDTAECCQRFPVPSAQ